jgi:serine/threonine-protein kinase RsbW
VSATTVTVDVAPGVLSAPLVLRAVGSMAARAGLTLDRLDDASLLVEALVAHAGPGSLRVRIEAGIGGLALLAGPYLRERADELLTERPLPDSGALMATLADDSALRVVSDDAVYVRVHISAR